MPSPVLTLFNKLMKVSKKVLNYAVKMVKRSKVETSIRYLLNLGDSIIDREKLMNRQVKEIFELRCRVGEDV